ncbi:ATP-binding protein [Roseicyclus marinus]|uniref:hypothetical protein n=1 Tax=Roseicyclus marinus TaxID=2161673 RepID=UPI0024102326|nr:hypothetical protein [Roseicyclus marinus]MDG3042651.1 hypothetical protein [Roseicyclus marinus]
MTRPDWHYPRKPFTHDTFVALTRGPVPAMSLFGPRRTGKTEFLLHDLGHHAADRYGHRVLYASFWQSSVAPLGLLLYAVSEALRPRSYAERVADWLRHPPVKVRIGSDKGPGALEIDLSERRTARLGQDLLLLDDLLGQLADRDKPAILLLDEVQELATAPGGGEIMAGLRTALDRRRDGLKTVFTGSSQIGLNRIFSTRDAPLYRFAAPLTLPPLGPDFVAHQLEVFHAVFQRRLDPATAQGFFDRFGGNPMAFQRWLMTLGQYRELPEDVAAERTATALAHDLDFDRIWLELQPHHRAMARILAEGDHDPFGATGAARFEALTGQPAPIPQTRQSHVRTLARRGLADQWDREWRLTDPLFEAWVLDRPEAEI